MVGDLRQPEALRTALRGCDALVHVAADYRLWVRDPKEMYAANVDGTRELLRMAREEGVAKVVYTSSVATMGFKADGTIVDEDTPVSLARHDRAVQAVEVYGRAGGDPGCAGGSACHDPESDDADWAGRCEANADGADRRGFSESASFPRMWIRG